MSPQEAEDVAGCIAEEAALLGPEEGDELIRRKTKDFPPHLRQLLLTSSAKFAEQKRAAMNKQDQDDKAAVRTLRKSCAIGGGVAVLLLVGILIFIPHPTPAQWWAFRILGTLGGAGFAGGLSGFLKVEGKLGTLAFAAGGALAVFWILYTKNPPPLPGQ